MLTLYYVTATFLQSWRIKNVCNKIAEQLAQQASVSFYTLPPATEDGYVAALATSELCVNRNAAKVSEILWLHGQQRGCCLSPVQTVEIMPWISFPETPAPFLPFAHSAPPPELLAHLVTGASKKDALHLLVETETQPCYERSHNEDFVRIEEYGKLIAWKIDSHLALLVETDVEHFTKLLISTYLQNNFLINDQLPLLRIESVNYEGKAQPFELLASHLRKPTRNAVRQSDDEWQKHLEDLRALGVLAHQATEFEHSKSRTAGKSSVVKPDLIPHEKKGAGSAAAKTTTSTETAAIKIAPIKTTATTTIVPITATVTTTIAPITATATTTIAPLTATVTTATTTSTKADKSSLPVAKGVMPTNTSPLADEGKPISLKQESAKAAGSTAPAAIVATTAEKTAKLIKAETTKTAPAISTTSSTSPLGRMKAKPTEIKKPSSVTADSRFKTTKVTETTVTKDNGATKYDPPVTVSAAAAVINTTITTQANVASTKTKELEEKATGVQLTSPLRASTQVPPTTTVATSKEGAAASTPVSMPSALSNGAAAKRPSLRRHKDSLCESKPLNILVYSDSVSARESVLNTLKDVLEHDTYTIYALTPQQVTQKYWLENTALLVVCGGVATNIGEILVDYFLRGGKVLSLCSDILHFILPNYRTAEVREHELVQFSYDKWQKIKMMHHIFCYQPSPVKKNFSTDSDDAAQSNAKKPALVCPRSVELKDLHGELHNLDVKVLGTEETWNTPSLLLANSIKSGGRAVFSQVHLETSPSQFEMDESKYSILRANEKIRLEIFGDLLSKHLSVYVQQPNPDSGVGKCNYQQAYFLGRHESKFELLDRLKSQSTTDKTISTSKLTIQFCGKNEKPVSASTNVLPILIHSCPEDFSTVEYFDDLKTNYIGRLVIYAPIVSSSMNVINELELTNGIVVLARQQTEGVGRSNNQWLSPLGCAMFSIQLHIALNSSLGSRLPLIQHIIGAAVVNTLRGSELYKDLDISLKWPNDIYANHIHKIGGLIVKTTLLGSTAIMNVGCGINLDNEKPTTCINELIGEYNRANRTHLPRLKYEEFLALVFNEIERLLEVVQAGDFDTFYKLYYELWLHNEQTIKICGKDGKQQEAQVIGVDDYGYLKVKTVKGVVDIVQPDGNSFDMLQGLIVPKFN